jgi:hypothetical protein
MYPEDHYGKKRNNVRLLTCPRCLQNKNNNVRKKANQQQMMLCTTCHQQYPIADGQAGYFECNLCFIKKTERCVHGSFIPTCGFCLRMLKQLTQNKTEEGEEHPN